MGWSVPLVYAILFDEVNPEPLTVDMVNPDDAVMVSESVAGDKFNPVNVYVSSLDTVLMTTSPNDKDVGFTFSAGVVAETPVPVTATFCVIAPPPALLIVAL
jgi:hypothetical protein